MRRSETTRPEHRIYADHAAGAPLRPEARQAWLDATRQLGNPASAHGSGRAAHRLLTDAREELAALLGAQPDELVLTSGGSEANSIALLGAGAQGARERFLISAVEHPSVAGVVRHRPGLVDIAGVDVDGRLSSAELADKLSPAHRLVSVMWVNNETGTIQPVHEVVEAAHRVGALAHSDAVQAVGHLPVHFADQGLDLLSLSAHKFGGPVGIGALLVRRGVRLEPVGLGGGQEAGLRSGTQPVALAVAMAAAARVALAGREAAMAVLARWRMDLVAALGSIPGVRIDGGEQVSPAILHLSVRGVGADDLVLLLDREGVDVASGSACHAGLSQPSEVLIAMGRSPEQARQGLRISPGWTTTGAELARLGQVLPAVIGRLLAEGD